MEIEISTSKPPDIDRLIELFLRAGWGDKTDPARLEAMIRNSTVIATAWHAERMVGFARCTSDRAFNAQINNVVVDEDFRGRGIGRRLVEPLLHDSEQASYLLRAEPESLGFYEKLGFEPADLALVYPRKR
jgi:ribosomal protein S18 acetylase RimI-like enzyme